MASGRSQIKETLSNCFGVIKSSPPLLSVLIYLEFYVAFMITLFALVGYSVGQQTLTLLLMAGLQTVIAVPGYLYMMWNEPKYLFAFALVQLAAFTTEITWAVVVTAQSGFIGNSALLFLLAILQLSNVIVSFFFRDLRIDFCCCGKNRRASGANSVSLESGLTPPPSDWAKTKPAPSLSGSEKVGGSASSPRPARSDSHQSGDAYGLNPSASEKAPPSRKSAIKNALRRKKRSVDFETEEKNSKNGTAHSPLEKNIFGGISEEERERAMQKRLSRMPVHTPSRSMTKTPDEVRVEPGSTSSSSRKVVPPKKAARTMAPPGSGSKKGASPGSGAGSAPGSKEGSGSRERTSSESLRQTSVTIK